MIKDYRLLIFDWDGTLVDSAADIVSNIRQAIEQADLEARSDAQLRNIIGLGFAEGLELLYPGQGAVAKSALQKAFREIRFLPPSTCSPLFLGVQDFLTQLHESGYWLAVATGKSKRGLQREIAANNLESLFYATRTAEETLSKPDPQMLFEIIEELDVSADQVLMIGDTTYDIEMANNAGIDAISLGSGVHSQERLEAYSPRAHLGSVTELIEWLEV